MTDGAPRGEEIAPLIQPVMQEIAREQQENVKPVRDYPRRSSCPCLRPDQLRPSNP